MIQNFHFCKLRQYNGPGCAYGYLTLQAPSTGLTDLALDFTLVDSGHKEIDRHLKRYIARMRPGEQRSFGFQLPELGDIKIENYSAKVSLNWRGGGQPVVGLGDYEQPLKAIRGSETLRPPLRDVVQVWEEKLQQIADEVRRERGVEVDYWSHTLGEKLGGERYTLGLEVPLPGDEHGRHTRSGIRIDLESTAGEPKVAKAGVTWDGSVYKSMDEAIKEAQGKKSPPLRVEQIEGLLHAWAENFREGLKLGHAPGETGGSAVLSVGVASESKEVQPEDLPDSEVCRRIWQDAFAQLWGPSEGEAMLSEWTAGGSTSDLDEITKSRKIQGLPGLTEELLESLDQANQVPYRIPLDFQLGGLTTTPGVWIAEPRTLYQIYPNLIGVFVFSRPGFSKDGERAVVSIVRSDFLFSGEKTGPNSGMSNLLCLMERHGEHWKLLGWLDRMELFKTLTSDDFKKMTEMRLRREIAAAGLKMTKYEEADFSGMRFEVEQPDGRSMEVVSPDWLHRNLYWQEKSNFFFTRLPLWVSGERRGVDIKKAMAGMELSLKNLRPVPELQSEIDKLLEAGRPLLQSVKVLGMGPLDGTLPGEAVVLEVVTKDGRKLSFVVKGFDDRLQTPAALERLIYLREAEPRDFLEAIEAYLRGDTP